MEIKNQVVVITGGGSGMGAETARYLCQRGAQVILLDYRLEEAQKVAQEIGAWAILCNVCDAESAKNAIEAVIKKWGAVTVCVNCAGIAPAARIVGRTGPMPLDAFRRVIEVNLIGTFNVMRLCIEHMMQHNPLNSDGERGVIINTASIAAYEGQIGQVAYAASKGGVISMTLPVAREVGKWGIRVMTIAPGVVSTPMMQAMPDAVQERLTASIPFPHRLGHAHEYASLVAEIIQNPYLNGSVVRLDGALRMEA